ncbi:hypothetical protein BN1263160059 [Stenotrophomonas thermophila]|nr:hypothetical protein BN1263160059 [Stenotrophomonas maltophilia]
MAEPAAGRLLWVSGSMRLPASRLVLVEPAAGRLLWDVRFNEVAGQRPALPIGPGRAGRWPAAT